MRWDDLTQRLMEVAGKKVRGGADVCGTVSREMVVSFEYDKLKSVSAAETAVIDLRVLNDDRLGAAATNKMVEGELMTVVSEALEVSRHGKTAGFDLPKELCEDLVLAETFDEKVEKLTEEQLAAKGRQLVDRVRETRSDMTVAYLGFATSAGETLFLNTNGIRYRQRESEHAFWVSLSRVSEGDFFQLGLSESGVRADIDYDRVVDEALELVGWGDRVVRANSGKVRVCFAPEAARSLIKFFVAAANGKLVNEGVSRFAGKLGKKLFDSKFGMFEDPGIDFRPGSRAVDDEGVATRKKELIHRGVVTGFYYDLAEGVKAGVGSTGNGFRQSFLQAEPDFTNLVVEGGKRKFKDLLQGEREMLVVYSVLGGGQNNPYNGDFQLGVSLGYWVSGGEVCGRVKDVSVAGNVFELFKDELVWLSEDGKWEGNFWLPYMTVQNVVLTSK